MTDAERIYYDRRAAEYDDWYLGTGLYAARVRPGWREELDALRALLRALSARSVLDVACGTGYLFTRSKVAIPRWAERRSARSWFLELARSNPRPGQCPGLRRGVNTAVI